MDDEIRRLMQPHLGEAEKLSDAELHTQLHQLEYKSTQWHVYNYEFTSRRLRKLERRYRHVRIWIWILLALGIAGLVVFMFRMRERVHQRHMGHDQPAAQVRDHGSHPGEG